MPATSDLIRARSDFLATRPRLRLVGAGFLSCNRDARFQRVGRVLILSFEGRKARVPEGYSSGLFPASTPLLSGLQRLRLLLSSFLLTPSLIPPKHTGYRDYYSLKVHPVLRRGYISRLTA